MVEKSHPKESLRILNSKEKKEINERLMQQWGAELDKSFVFLLSNKEKLYIANADISMIDFSKVRVDTIGLYVCTVDDKSIRLSIEGSQLIGPKATKNVVDIDDDELDDWFGGRDIERTVKECSGPVIVRHNADFVGCGKMTAKGILNFVPKTRRINPAD